MNIIDCKKGLCMTNKETSYIVSFNKEVAYEEDIKNKIINELFNYITKMLGEYTLATANRGNTIMSQNGNVHVYESPVFQIQALREINYIKITRYSAELSPNQKKIIKEKIVELEEKYKDHAYRYYQLVFNNNLVDQVHNIVKNIKHKCVYKVISTVADVYVKENENKAEIFKLMLMSRK